MLFRRTYVTFESDYPLAESVARLFAATRERGLATIGTQAAVGKVEPGKVRLSRVDPKVNNSFKPIFAGAFEEADGRVVLRGSFGMHPVLKVLQCFWFGSLFSLTVLFAWRMPSAADAWGVVLMGLVMSALGLGLLALGKWFARNDEAWLSNVIQQALRREAR